jgi:hypothetical protein
MSKWNAENYVTAYELARSGMTEAKIAEALGVSVGTFHKWEAQRPAFKSAVERGRQVRKGRDRVGFHEYVFNRLPAGLRKVWQRIQDVQDEPNGLMMIESMLEDRGKSARQHLFLYALTSSNFNVNKALHSLNISRKTFNEWCTGEPEFAQMMRELHEYKKDFFDAALVGLVDSGDTAATIFANKTFNADRYREQAQQLHVTGEVVHEHRLVSMESLNLPLEVRVQILEAIRRANVPALEGSVVSEETP